MNYEANGCRPDPITITKRFIEIMGGLDEAREHVKVVSDLRTLSRTLRQQKRNSGRKPK
jgi:hypothetical protein